MKEGGIHVDSEPCDGYNPDRILQDGYGKNAQDKAGPLPIIGKQKVLSQQTGNEQGQSGVNATALFCDLNIDPRQGELEAVPDYGHSYEME